MGSRAFADLVRALGLTVSRRRLVPLVSLGLFVPDRIPGAVAARNTEASCPL